MKDIARSYLEKIAGKGKTFLTGYSVERTREQKEPFRGTLWSSLRSLLENAYHHSMRLVIKSKKVAFLSLVLAFIGFCIISSLEQQFALAAEAHIVHSSSASAPLATKASPGNNAGTPKPSVINGQWYCNPPYVPEAQVVGNPPDPNQNGKPGVSTPFKMDCVEKRWAFPCSDIIGPNGRALPSESIISRDWLSGNVSTGNTSDAQIRSGHLIYTYPEDTYDFPAIRTLFGFTMALGFLVLTPTLLLLGYQIMLGASSFRYAGALEGLSSAALGAVAVGVSFTLVQMLMRLEGTVVVAIVHLHNQYPFPQTPINGIPIPYILPGDPAISYRGIVIPMSRWGCTTNDFIGIFALQFMTDSLATIIPLAGHFTHLAGTVTTLSDLIHRTGQMVLTVLSILLWLQVFIRIILLNYYILTAPLAFGCWALPGGTGQRVVRLWFKGFFSVLFVQVLQLFLLTTVPLLLPTLPQIPPDSVGILQGLLLEFPPILTLSVTLMAPTLIGASAAKAFGTAGSMAGQTVVVIGTAASKMA